MKMARHAGDDHAGATRLDDFAELIEHQGHTEQVDAKDRVDVGLLRRDTRGMNEIGDRSEHRRIFGEISH